MPDLSPAEFGELFTCFEHTAFRLETRESYASSAYGDEPFRKFLAGAPDDHAWRASWDAKVATSVAAGKRFERVRVVSVPLSDYSRFSLAQVPLNAKAGEDIRYLPRAQAIELGLPDEDYWLFDSRQTVTFHYGPDGTVARRELLTDPAGILRRNYWRDTGWHYAIGWVEFTAMHGR